MRMPLTCLAAYKPRRNCEKPFSNRSITLKTVVYCVSGLMALISQMTMASSNMNEEIQHSALHAQFASQPIQFLHWWTSRGEVAAVREVHGVLGSAQIVLESVPVEGAGGKMAKSILQARAIAGNPPDMAQLEGPAIKSWAALGFLHDVNKVANENHWDQKLPPLLREIHWFNHEYVALPMTIHRLNWLWVNTQVLNSVGLPIPKTWPEMVTTFRQLKAKGIAPLAMGNEPWQVVQLFENIAFGLGGPAYYREAFIELDHETLTSPITHEALMIFRQISEIVLSDMPNQPWEDATQALLSGERAFQISGDWVAGEILASEGEFPSRIQCYATPARQAGFIYNIDSFAFFKKPTLDKWTVEEMVTLLSTPVFQARFNQRKGSLPAFQDVSLEGFNPCALQARADFKAAEQAGTLMPSVVDSMAVSPVIERAASSELYRFFNHPEVKPEDVILHMKNMKIGM